MPNEAKIDQLLARARKLVKSQSSEALALAENARNLAVEAGAHDKVAAALCLHASALLMLGRGDETLHVLQSVRTLAQTHPVGLHEGESLQLLGQTHFNHSQYAEAGECWRRCLLLPNESISIDTRVRAHMGVGMVHMTLERYDMALEHHRMAESLALESDNPLLHSDAQLHVATDLIKLGQVDTAMQLLKEALPQIRAEKNYALEGEIYGLIGEIHLAQGELEKANAVLMVALKINRLAINLACETANLISLGLCELGNNEKESALEYLHDARTLAIECGSKRLQARAEQVLEKICLAMHDPDTASMHAAEYQQLQAQILHPHTQP